MKKKFHERCVVIVTRYYTNFHLIWKTILSRHLDLKLNFNQNKNVLLFCFDFICLNESSLKMMKRDSYFNLTFSWRRPLSYKNQSIDLFCKSMDWFLYDNGLCHDKTVKVNSKTYDITNWETSNYNTLFVQYLKKQTQI